MGKILLDKKLKSSLPKSKVKSKNLTSHYPNIIVIQID